VAPLAARRRRLDSEGAGRAIIRVAAMRVVVGNYLRASTVLYDSLYDNSLTSGRSAWGRNHATAMHGMAAGKAPPLADVSTGVTIISPTAKIARKLATIRVRVVTIKCL
jgi:hypothetical protein